MIWNICFIFLFNVYTTADTNEVQIYCDLEEIGILKNIYPWI